MIRLWLSPVSIRSFLLLGMVAAAGCAAAPPPVTIPEPSYEQKLSAILRLEDRRILRDPAPVPAVETPPAEPRRTTAVSPPSLPSPDLTTLVADPEARVRRRAALAIGRTRLPEGVPALTTALADTDPEVRGIAAFSIGLIGESSAEAALAPLLDDSAPFVRGRAAQALGLIGAKAAAPAIGALATEYVTSPAVAAMTPDDETWPAAPEAEAFKLAIFALVRLQAYEPLAAAVLDGDRPRTTWWPVAFALQRIQDARAERPLLQLLDVPGTYTRAFAARGLGGIKAAGAVERLRALLDPKAQAPLEVVVSAIRALAQIGGPGAAPSLIELLRQQGVPANVRLEIVTALGALKSADGLPMVQDLLTDPWPIMRAQALRSAAAIDPDTFMLVIAGMEPDRDWRVRAALAGVLGGLDQDGAADRLRALLKDEDKRVIEAVLPAMVRARLPDTVATLRERLGDSDYGVRSAAAAGLEQLTPPGAEEALRAAYEAALPDASYDARAAILEALAAYGPAAATPTLERALEDRDWALRLHALDLLRRLDPAAAEAATIRPVPGSPVTPYDDPQLIAPPYSPHVFIETARGTIEFELAVLDAPQTTHSFMALARKGYFNGLPIHRVVPNFVVQDGDPRGDGRGGPGYSLRDEINERPYLRGTVGMALSWRDTGGSQFFITHSPQPHLDAGYTAFGHVVNGMEVVDRLQQGDVIERVRVWDGTGWLQ